GVSGVSTDMRDIHDAIAEGNDRAHLALKMMCYQIKKYIGSYAAAMGGLDAVVFTGGIGENDWAVRERSCKGLEFLGIKINQEANDGCRVERRISTDDSTTQVWIINTNEEMLIARDTKAIVEAL
ncbi:MAG: acetate kinase, partial [Firmicutes bacterium]|nr:acetate kinase [Bacillota bacterium]